MSVLMIAGLFLHSAHGDLQFDDIARKISSLRGSARRVPMPAFQFGTDLLELHYDFAPDRDDAHSAALDRTILETRFSCNSQFRNHMLAVTGTYGTNKGTYIPESVGVMNKAWNDCGGYLDADKDWNRAVKNAAKEWRDIIRGKGKVFIKEGGQSDFTADVIRRVRSEYKQFKDFNPEQNVIVIQHSQWNEDYTTRADLNYVKDNTFYIRIDDANPYLQIFGAGFFEEFKLRTLASKDFGEVWETALDFYSHYEWGANKNRPVVDASDTGELMYILGMGKVGLMEVLDMYFPYSNPDCNPKDATQFEDVGGLVVIEAESLPHQCTFGWTFAKSLRRDTGDGYIMYTGPDSFPAPTGAFLTADIRIRRTGTYKFLWRSYIEGNDNHEQNDSWLKIEADDFYAQKENGGTKHYPRGGDNNGPYPNGQSSDGFFKVFRNGKTNEWSFVTKTSDNEGLSIYARFRKKGTYTITVAGRSNGHFLDRLVLYHTGRYTEAQATDLSLKETRSR